MNPPQNPQLCLTMIVRDEAEQLPGFLEHHEDLADELVIVDTGSRDRSIEIARSAGARIVEFAWRDDFAAARNAGLAVAKAAWILFLDADERISREDFSRLRAQLSPPADRVYLQETWNYCLGTSHLEWQPLRGRYGTEEAGQTGMFVARRVGLFPRDPKLVFSGRVHESVLPAVQAAGLKVETLDIPVHHYGYARSDAVNEARHARYRHLVERKYVDDPSDPAVQLELATVLLESGEPRQALVHLENLSGGPAGLRPVVRGLVLQGRLRREMGEHEAARKLLTEAVAQDPDFLFAWLESLRIEAEVEDWTTAQAILDRAEARFGRKEPQLLREALRIKIQNRQLPAALAAATELVRFCPQWQEIRDLRDRLQRMLKHSGEV